MSFQGLYSVRDGKESDKNFILSTMLKGLYFGSIDKENPSNTLLFGMVPQSIFFDKYKLVAKALVDSGVTMKIACLPEDEDVILGYALYSDTTLFWVFVKDRWRSRGIATSLVPKTVRYIAHLNILGKSLRHKLPNAEFNPFF